jgi:hypothetical protein
MSQAECVTLCQAVGSSSVPSVLLMTFNVRSCPTVPFRKSKAVQTGGRPEEASLISDVGAYVSPTLAWHEIRRSANRRSDATGRIPRWKGPRLL